MQWPILGLTQLHWGDWDRYLMQLGGWPYTECIMWRHYWYTIFYNDLFHEEFKLYFVCHTWTAQVHTSTTTALGNLTKEASIINLWCLGSKFTCVAMVTCMQVLHRLHQCSCKEKMEVKSCGHGKFVITKAGKKMTLYARVRSNLPSSWKCVDPFMALISSCLTTNIKGSSPSRAL